MCLNNTRKLLINFIGLHRKFEKVLASRWKKMFANLITKQFVFMCGNWKSEVLSEYIYLGANKPFLFSERNLLFKNKNSYRTERESIWKNKMRSFSQMLLYRPPPLIWQSTVPTQRRVKRASGLTRFNCGSDLAGTQRSCASFDPQWLLLTDREKKKLGRKKKYIGCFVRYSRSPVKYSCYRQNCWSGYLVKDWYL